MIFSVLLAFIGRLAPDIGLNLVKRANAVKRLFGNGRLICCVNIKELAPDMGPVGRFRHGSRFEDGIEARIAIGMQNALEGLEMSLRMHPLAVG